MVGAVGRFPKSPWAAVGDCPLFTVVGWWSARLVNQPKATENLNVRVGRGCSPLPAASQP